MRVARHHQRPRHDVTLFHHHLMGNAGAGRIIIHALLRREGCNSGVLLEVLRRCILNIVIDRENRLARVRDRGRADLFELRHYRRGVVVRHDMPRANRNEIPGAHGRPSRQSVCMPRRNFFNQSKAHKITFSSRDWRKCHFFAARFPSHFAMSKSTKSA